MRIAKAAIDKYCPGLPIQFTEWGPSWVTNTSEAAAVNANNVGAAWATSFLNTMLGCGVDKALYLVTTDIRQQENGNWVDIWGCGALFLNPPVYGGKAYPKPIYHLFDMVSRLEGHRIESTRGNDIVNCFVSADPDQRKITMLVWNFGAVIPETGPDSEKAVTEKTQVRVRDAEDFFHSQQVKVETWQINENTDNIHRMLTTGVQPDENNTAMAQLATTTAKIAQGALDFQLVLPPSSVSLVVMTEAE